MNFDWKEAIGIVATIFVLCSFVSKNITVVRSVNIVGSIIFVVYGLLIGSLSVWLLNLCCAGLNIYHLIRIRQEKRQAVQEVMCDAQTDSN